MGSGGSGSRFPALRRGPFPAGAAPEPGRARPFPRRSGCGARRARPGGWGRGGGGASRRSRAVTSALPPAAPPGGRGSRGRSCVLGSTCCAVRGAGPARARACGPGGAAPAAQLSCPRGSGRPAGARGVLGGGPEGCLSGTGSVLVWPGVPGGFSPPHAGYRSVSCPPRALSGDGKPWRTGTFSVTLFSSLQRKANNLVGWCVFFFFSIDTCSRK